MVVMSPRSRHQVAPAATGTRHGLVALAIGGFAIGTTEFATIGVLPDIAHGFRTSIPTAGQLVWLYALGLVLGAPLFALVGTWMSRKTLLVVLMAAFTVANLASVIAPTFGTLAVTRFLSGLPHGAYFGIGGIVAATLVPADRRARAVAAMMLGLTGANVVGVPLATVLGQTLGWRAAYVLAAVVGLIAALGIVRWIPDVALRDDTGWRGELGALRRPQLWLALVSGAIGFGGFFGFYSYIAPTLTDVAGVSHSATAIVLMIVGVAMSAGTFAGGRLADVSVMRTICAALASLVVTLAIFAVAAHSTVSAVIVLFAVAASACALVPAQQARVMDVAGSAQSLAGALNQSALSLGNALGAWLSGLAIAAHGYAVTGWVGASLAAGGIAIAATSALLDRPRRTAVTRGLGRPARESGA